MKAHINSTTNPEPLKQLKKLLFKNEPSEILAYVKGEFSTHLDTYINMSENVAQLENQVKKMRLDSLDRQIAYNEAMDKLNTMIEEDEKRFGLK